MDHSYAPPPVLAKQKPRVEFRCPRCGDLFVLCAEDVPEAGMPLGCPHCRLDFKRLLLPPDATSPVEGCWLCAGTDLYIQRDFNPALGTLITFVFVLLSLLVLVIINALLGIGCLLVVVLANIAVYRLLSSCTVCYRCRSIYRGFPESPRHSGFFVGQDEWQERSRRDWLQGILPSGGGRSPSRNPVPGERS